MTQITFIRHLKTENGMGDHAALSLQTLQDLSTHAINPSIDKLMYPQAEAFLKYERVDHIDRLLHSTILRTKQTALLLAKSFSVPERMIQEISSLDEMYFEPVKLVSEDEWAKEGMDYLRIAVYKGVLSNTGAEGIQSIYKRIRQLDELIHRHSEEVLVCVTHGFYMRFLELYFKNQKKDPQDITLEDIVNATIYDYGTGFSITL